MKYLIAAATTLAALVAIAPASNAASFVCSSHITYTERAICDNPGLSYLDSHMASLYFGLYNHLYGGARFSLRQGQIQWLGSRNGCGANVGCLATLYHGRINYLQSYGYGY